MSLLGGYKKKTNYDGYESLQLVDSSGDFNNRERSGSSIPANLAARAGPVTPDDYSTMDSSDMDANYGGGLLDMVKGGAGKFFSNFKDNIKDTLKDTSTKVMHQVSTYTKGELDIAYITSRIIVMSYPADAVEIEDVRSFLDSRHMDHYTVFNLSQRNYRGAKFSNRVSECNWPARQAPSLHNLFAVCKNMHNWLRQNPKNVCVITCTDGRAPSGVLVCAMFCFCHLFYNPVPAMQLLSAKRPGSGLWPSHRRCICRPIIVMSSIQFWRGLTSACVLPVISLLLLTVQWSTLHVQLAQADCKSQNYQSSVPYAVRQGLLCLLKPSLPSQHCNQLCVLLWE